MHHTEFYRPIVDFLTRIGIAVTEAPLPVGTFLPGIALRDGGLVVDLEKLQWPGDLLHEAGHLAVLPPADRAAVDDALSAASDSEHSGELEALAWAYAASVEIGLPPRVLIHEGGYLGKSRDLLQMYAFGVYPGLQGLCEIGMSSAPGFTPDCGELRYPRMLRWLRD